MQLLNGPSPHTDSVTRKGYPHFGYLGCYRIFLEKKMPSCISIIKQKRCLYESLVLHFKMKAGSCRWYNSQFCYQFSLLLPSPS